MSSMALYFSRKRFHLCRNSSSGIIISLLSVRDAFYLRSRHLTEKPICRAFIVLLCFSIIGFSPLTTDAREKTDGVLGLKNGLKLSAVSGIKRFVFSDTDGYVFLSLRAAFIRPDTRKLGFLDMPKHGLVLENPILTLKSSEVSGEDWSKMLKVFRELSLVTIEGLLVLELPEENTWELTGKLKRHPEGVVFQLSPGKNSFSGEFLLLGFDPRSKQIFSRQFSNPPEL